MQPCITSERCQCHWVNIQLASTPTRKGEQTGRLRSLAANQFDLALEFKSSSQHEAASFVGARAGHPPAGGPRATARALQCRRPLE